MDADFNTKGRRCRDSSLFMRSSRHAYTGGLLQLHFLQSRFDLGLRAKAAVLSLLLPLRVTIVEEIETGLQEDRNLDELLADVNESIAIGRRKEAVVLGEVRPGLRYGRLIRDLRTAQSAGRV